MVEIGPDLAMPRHKVAHGAGDGRSAHILRRGRMFHRLRAAAEALYKGDPEPFVSLLAPDVEWRGVPQGRLWWKHTPS
jgi:hypothetical protein